MKTTYQVLIWLIETWDVLKYCQVECSVKVRTRINRNMRCIEIENQSWDDDG